MKFLVLLFIAILAVSSGFRLPKTPFNNQQTVPKTISKKLDILNIAILMSTPTAALADDGKFSFALPLGIALFTMVPFLYYQQ